MEDSKRSLKLPVGLDRESRELKRIDEVKRGLSCNCVCPGCGQDLVARKGELKTDHFAHHGNSPEHPESCAESALHKWAKTIIASQTRWPLAPRHYTPKTWHTPLNEPLESHDGSWSPFQGDFFTVDSAAEEHHFGDWKPDVLLTGHFSNMAARIAIEVYVFHQVDDNKLEKVKESDISLLEINLDGSLLLNKLLTEKELTAHVLNLSNHRWLHSPLADKLKKEHDLSYEQTVALPAIQRREREVKRFIMELSGRPFLIPKCGLFDFNDGTSPRDFHLIANGQTINIAAGEETVVDKKEVTIANVEELPDRLRLHINTRPQSTHPLDLVIRSDRSDLEHEIKTLSRISTLLMVTASDAPVESWLSSGTLSWVYSKRREAQLSKLQAVYQKEKKRLEKLAQSAHERRVAASRRLANQVLDLMEQFAAVEPEWSHKHSDEFKKARELARCLDKGRLGNYGLSQRTRNDWVFGIPGLMWKTILAAEMIQDPDFLEHIHYKSLHFFLRKNRIWLHPALKNLWKIKEGKEIFDEEAAARNVRRDLPSAGSALYHWLEHLSQVHPHRIVKAGPKSFRWAYGQRERLLNEDQT